MIKSVKQCLRKAIARSTLKSDELSNLLVEIESVINCQPLTFVYDDVDGISFTLIPAHLIYGRQINMTLNSVHHEIISTHLSLTKRVRHHRRLLEQFTNCWKKDNLLNLREHSYAGRQQKRNSCIKVEDVVLLYNEGTKRAFWRHAVVERLIKGTDEHVRAAVIRMSDEKGHVKLLQRSIQHLIPLEVSTEDTSEDTTNELPSPTEDTRSPSQDSTRSKRGSSQGRNYSSKVDQSSQG